MSDMGKDRFTEIVFILYMILLSILPIIATSTAESGKSDDTEEGDEFVNYLADFQAVVETSKGAFTISFLPDIAPAHVLNFIALAETGFYNGLTFHRYVEGFVVQGGDPLANGTGGPGYTLPAELSEKPLHVKGALGMARTGDDTNPERRSSGSQFYICLDDVHRLDTKYTVWGNIADGMDVVLNLRVGDAIKNVEIRKIGKAFEENVVSVIAELEKEATDPVTGLKYIDLKAIVTTSKGDFELGFYYAGAPEHVANFVKLAHEGFFDGMKFDRYEPDMLIEAGSPVGEGSTQPESIPFEFHPDYKHIKGAAGMALAPGVKDEEIRSSGNRFYICLADIPDLNGKQTVWAFVAKGMDVVLELRVGDIIESIRIEPLAETRHAGQ